MLKFSLISIISLISTMWKFFSNFNHDFTGFVWLLWWRLVIYFWIFGYLLFFYLFIPFLCLGNYFRCVENLYLFFNHFFIHESMWTTLIFNEVGVETSSENTMDNFIFYTWNSVVKYRSLNGTLYVSTLLFIYVLISNTVIKIIVF